MILWAIGIWAQYGPQQTDYTDSTGLCKKKIWFDLPQAQLKWRKHKTHTGRQHRSGRPSCWSCNRPILAVDWSVGCLSQVSVDIQGNEHLYCNVTLFIYLTWKLWILFVSLFWFLANIVNSDRNSMTYYCILSIHVHITIMSFALNCSVIVVYSLEYLYFDSLPFALTIYSILLLKKIGIFFFTLSSITTNYFQYN